VFLLLQLRTLVTMMEGLDNETIHIWLTTEIDKVLGYFEGLGESGYNELLDRIEVSRIQTGYFLSDPLFSQKSHVWKKTFLFDK
jgi:hypothetical protein